MENEKLKGLLTLGSLLGVLGLLSLFFSPNLGTALADSWLVAQGDYADSSLYEFKLKANTNNFFAIGSILFTIGLTTIVFTYYKMLTVKD
ncbi:hypothetical protein [Oceanobacillus bengalensis]|uniref:Uncharacterized protein n=1 Tax=Oceanobacillus bengalensis TaxID=1435466 RepID=A0A494Z3I9_9BACI|nr:hypothetical protein [Oceanobacillus bengalensis]RKQ17088.1 hypothetical protein D8M05_05295 [Oceanobacillus bengalensis]